MANKRLVVKFGGTSVGNADAIRQAGAMVQAAKADWPEIVVVVSAMSGVTNALLRGAHSAAAGDDKQHRSEAQALHEKHHSALEALLSSAEERAQVAGRVDFHLAEFETLCHAVYVLGEASPRALDTISSLGERISHHLVSAYLREIGLNSVPVNATRLIRTDNRHQGASPDMTVTQALTRGELVPLLSEGVVPVVTGFIGANTEGVLTTLGRGGSDFTAGILGAVLDADEVWIATDVDGVMSADPRVVPAARLLPEISYREVSELAFFGAKVLHPRTIQPVIERGIALRIRNTFAPEAPGTLVVQQASNGGAIKAVTAIRGQSLLTVEGRGMVGVQGIAARTFAAVARAGASVILISQASSEQSICLSVADTQTNAVIAALEDELAAELRRRDVDRIWAERDTVIVTVVGAGMQHTPGIAGKVFTALGNEGLNVRAIAQGSSECSISLVVTAAQADDSVRAIHRLIEEGRNG